MDYCNKNNVGSTANGHFATDRGKTDNDSTVLEKTFNHSLAVFPIFC